MSETEVESQKDAMRSLFASALLCTKLNNSSQSHIFGCLELGISVLQTILHDNEANIKRDEKPLLTKRETVRLIEEARFAFNLVIDGQPELLRDERDMDFSDRFAYVDEWYDNIQNDWKDFLKLHKALVAGLVDMYNARFKSGKGIPPQGFRPVEMSGEEAIAFSKVMSLLSKMKNFAVGSGIYKDVKDHVAELEGLVEEL
jgi:hypothetical protein